ncbi:hypothetical protein FA95DRAFT_1230952 [Auriscalpium vulgare]|uniref:Uncharacterized protein n=1 Tax=Auriscalpium vulgare TaxID=40419 RepID=A0ACB8RU61_9AGAM|nr:hypothetical protein FA95DRAFT_1230952 [Auriscalpium vulgare]
MWGGGTLAPPLGTPEYRSPVSNMAQGASWRRTSLLHGQTVAEQRMRWAFAVWFSGASGDELVTRRRRRARGLSRRPRSYHQGERGVIDVAAGQETKNSLRLPRRDLLVLHGKLEASHVHAIVAHFRIYYGVGLAARQTGRDEAVPRWGRNSKAPRLQDQLESSKRPTRPRSRLAHHLKSRNNGSQRRVKTFRLGCGRSACTARDPATTKHPATASRALHPYRRGYKASTHCDSLI